MINPLSPLDFDTLSNLQTQLPNNELSPDLTKELYKNFLQIIIPKSASNYYDFKRINEFLKIENIYSVSDINIISKWIEEIKLQDFDIKGKRQYSNALSKYLLFLQLIDLFSPTLKNLSSEQEKQQLSNTLQAIYYGTPGSGKSHAVKKLTANKTHFRTTFHPDSDYATFVGCYKPIVKTAKKEEVQPEEIVLGIAADSKVAYSTNKSEISYEFVPQAFTNAYVEAWQNPDTPVYLIIEEINRGNCAQIFGDLFQLLDRTNGISDYPIDADTDLKAYLIDTLGEDHEGITNGKLCLPANLHILATMNTSDQSLFPMDSAFKRRWTWKYVPIDYTNTDSGAFTITINDKTISWHDFLEATNQRIFDLTKSEDKQIGNFFIKESVDAEEFKNKVMFYLWNDILKEEYGLGDYFFRNANEKDNPQFTFNDLFSDKDNNKLLGFMKYIGVLKEDAPQAEEVQQQEA